MQFHDFLDGGNDLLLQLKVFSGHFIKWEWQTARLLESPSRQLAEIMDSYE
jgi:hypothetical protein